MYKIWTDFIKKQRSYEGKSILLCGKRQMLDICLLNFDSKSLQNPFASAYDLQKLHSLEEKCPKINISNRNELFLFEIFNESLLSERLTFGPMQMRYDELFRSCKREIQMF